MWWCVGGYLVCVLGLLILLLRGEEDIKYKDFLFVFGGPGVVLLLIFCELDDLWRRNPVIWKKKLKEKDVIKALRPTTKEDLEQIQSMMDKFFRRGI